MDVKPHKPEDVERLKGLIRRERNAKQRDRYRAVLLALEQKTTPQIVEKLDCSRSFVQKWVYRYRDGDLSDLKDKARSGQPPKLRRQAEELFKRRLDEGAQPADGVCTLRGKDIQRILAEEFNAHYSLDGAYDLLHRLGYSCLKPRPRHRKNNAEIMAQWKKEAPLLFKKSKSNIPASGLRSGSRTKADLANKAH